MLVTEHKPISESWRPYSKMLPGDCSPTLFNAARRAYFCGVGELVNLLYMVAEDDTERGQQLLTWMHEELMEFAQVETNRLVATIKRAE